MGLAEADTRPFSVATARKVRHFFGPNEVTPLAPLPKLAQEIGVSGIYAKDESKRLGQQAFKVFGGTFAMATWLARKLDVDLADVTGLADLKERYFKKFKEPTTFVTCTDGNHGRAVAYAAKHCGQKAIVYMPKGSADARVEHIRSHGGECTVTDMNYDHTVEFANKQAEKNGWILLQDTTLPNYLEIPTWIMQGYTAMADEAIEQMQKLNGSRPTHVFLQCGVGSMAGAVIGYLVEQAKATAASMPTIVILEPKNAACAFASAKRGDGETVLVEGDLETMIAGLACGELSTLGWPILARNAKGYFWVEDAIAGNGMRACAREGVESGECGGAAPGLLQRLMDPSCAKAAGIAKQLGIGSNSHVLFFNTEGATDPENYKKQIALPHVAASPADFDFAPALQVGPPASKL